MSNKIIFTKTNINEIVRQYTVLNLSCEQIRKLFNMSKLPINKLLKDLNLLKKGKSDYKKTYIEIKSDYTYEILLGKKENKWSNKIDTNQLEKIKWVNSNIKPAQILVVDKRNNKLIKKEIV